MLKFVKKKNAKDQVNTEDALTAISPPFDFKKLSYGLDLGGQVHIIGVVDNPNDVQSSSDRMDAVKKVVDIVMSRANSVDAQGAQSPVLQHSGFPIHYTYANPEIDTESSPSSMKNKRDKFVAWSVLDNCVPPPVPPRKHQCCAPQTYEDELPGSVQERLHSRSVDNPGYRSSSRSQEKHNSGPSLIPPIRESVYGTPNKKLNTLPFSPQTLHVGQVLPDVLPPARPPPVPRTDVAIQCDFELKYSSEYELDYTEVQSTGYVNPEMASMSDEDIRQVAEDMDNFFISQIRNEVGKMVSDAEQRIMDNAAKVAKEQVIDTLRGGSGGPKKQRPSLALTQNNGETSSAIFELSRDIDKQLESSTSLPEDPSPYSTGNVQLRSVKLIRQPSDENTTIHF